MTDLLAETRLTAEQQEYVESARECADELLQTINKLLDYSAWVAGHHRIETAEFQLRPVLERLSEQAKTQARGRSVQVVTHWVNDLPETVLGDEERLHQVLAQLLSNAVKFTPRGQVDFRAELEGPEAEGTTCFRFDVRDTGIGIPADQIGTIFESFRQLDGGLARRYPGLGVGLSLARKIAEAMGAQIAVRSQPGEGSIFSLRVPLVIPAGQKTEPVQQAAGARPHRVLVVDGSSVAQQALREMLERAQYEAVLAANGDEGVFAASRSHFDAIVMGLPASGTDSLTAASRIRELPAHHDTPIVAFTANCSDEQEARCRELGMEPYPTKTIDDELLLATLRRVMEQ
jgi:CheY-like chemotaxis protein